MVIYITFILLIISFMAKGYMDISAKDGFKNWWFNKTQSWQNKYAFPLKPKYKHWYYFGLMQPLYKEKFPFSSTALVMFTDFWHLSQFVFLNSFMIALALNMGGSIHGDIFAFICIRIVYLFSFNAIYK